MPHFKWPPDIDNLALWNGVTSGAGAGDGSTIVDTALTGFPVEAGMMVVVYVDQTGANRQVREILSFAVATATVRPFAAQIPAGVEYTIFVPLSPDERIGKNDANNAFDSSTVAANRDGSVFERLEFIQTLGVMAGGTADAGSDADTLIDAALTQVDDYWNGMLVLMLVGANAGLARPIVDFVAATDSAEVRPAFPNAIGVGDTYVILGAYHEVVPTLDGTEDYQPRDVIGRKTDTPTRTLGAVASLMRYIKGILGWVNGAVTSANTAALNLAAGEQTVFQLTNLAAVSEIGGAFISINAAGAGATVTVRVYRAINGTERQIDTLTVVNGTDPVGVPVLTGWMPLESTGGGVNSFRVTAQSNSPGDSAIVVPYSYTLRTMQ